jgi:hypothetical protein
MTFINPMAIVNGDRDIIYRLGRLDQIVHDRLLEPITELTQQLYNSVRPPGHFAAYKRMEIVNYPNIIQGRVFFNAPSGKEYGAIGALEYGAPGKRSRPPVSEHKRMQTHVWGRAISPIEVIVDRYKRRAHLVEQRFLRGPLAAIRSQAEQKLKEAAEAGAHQAMSA